MTNTEMQSFPLRKLLTEEDPLIGPPLVINLDKDKKRFEDLKEHLAQWDIVPERFSAVSDVVLPALPDCMKEYKYSVNLNMSHAAASRHRCLTSKRPYWLVLEDDCRFLEDPRIAIYECLLALNKAQKNDWSIISFGCFSYDKQGEKPKIEHPGLCQPKGWHPWGTHSLLINRPHSPMLIGMWSSCFWPADHLLLNEYNAGRAFLRRPAVTYQEEYTSHTGGKTETKRSADLSPEIIEKICQNTAA